MRRKDKSLAMLKANILFEQRNLKSKGLIKEDTSLPITGSISNGSFSLEYTIIKETEKAFLLEFDTYKGVKEEVVKLKTWVPKVWVELNKDHNIEENMKKSMEEHYGKLNAWMRSKNYNKVKYSLTKEVKKKPTHKAVYKYIDSTFFGGMTEVNVQENPDYKFSEKENIIDLVLRGYEGLFLKLDDNVMFFQPYEISGILKKVEDHPRKDDVELLYVKDIEVYDKLPRKLKNNHLRSKPKFVKI